jgi:signal peptidase I
MVARICRIAGMLAIGILSLLMITSAILYFMPVFGYRVDGLRSGSMSPVMNTGDMVITRVVSPDSIKTGDIITFHLMGNQNVLITHRVISIEPSPLLFQTKGDANGVADSLLTPASGVIGRVVCHVPSLGATIIRMKTPLGLVATLIFPGIVIVSCCVKSLYSEIACTRRPMEF